MKSKRKTASFMMAVCLSFVTCSSIGCIAFWTSRCYLNPFEGKVIDAETKEPIEGAAVLAVYYKGTMSIAGSDYYPADAREALTDVNGEFKIPPQSFRSDKMIGRPSGNIIIFKPGYGVFPDHKKSKAVGENKTWPPPGKYVVYELPKLKTRKERAKNVFDIEIQYDLEFSKQKLIIENVNEEFKNLGMIDRYIEEDGKPIKALVR